MATQNLTVTNHSCALNVVDLIIVGNKKSKETAAKCAFSGGNHPANCKCCESYHNLIKGNSTFRNNTLRTPPLNTNKYRNNVHHIVNSQEQRSYADVTISKTNRVEDTAITLTKFIHEFRGLFNQLLQQNSMILKMLTMLINKII
jgi:hypothetical protein